MVSKLCSHFWNGWHVRNSSAHSSGYVSGTRGMLGIWIVGGVSDRWSIRAG